MALDSSIVSWVVFLPMFTALALLAARVVTASFLDSAGPSGAAWRLTALAGSSLTFVLAVAGLWQGFNPEISDYQLVERLPWIPALGLHYFVGLDGISLVLVLLTSLVVPVTLLSSWKEIQQPLKSYVVALLFLETGINGVLVSLNLLQLYFFWELTLLSSLFLVGRFGGANGLRAGVRYLLSWLSGSFLMLIATLVVHRLNLEQGGVANFDLVSFGDTATVGLLSTEVRLSGTPGVAWWQTQSYLFAAFAVAFAIKVPLIPLHGWYNETQSEAPTSGSVIISALVVKLAAFAFLRIALPLFPSAARDAAPWLTGLALAGIAMGGLLSLAQRDVKRLLGYLSLAHLSFIVLGIFSLQHHAVVGSVVHMLSHGLCISALFILFGFLAERRSTRDLAEFGGLGKPMPICAVLLAAVVLGQVGLPGTSGFVGTFLVFLGSFTSRQFTTALALAGMVLAAGAMLRAAGKVLLGPLERAENRGLIDLDLRERVVVLLLVIPVLWVGLYPNPVLRRIEPPVSLLLNAMARATEGSEIDREQSVAVSARTSRVVGSVP